MPRIICAGLIAVDLVFEVSHMPAKGTKNRASTSRMIPGGGSLNAALAIAGLGGQVSLCGAVGDDVFGQFLRQRMRDRGIDDGLVSTVTEMPTSRSAIIITPDGDRSIINHRETGLAPASVALPTDFPFDAALVDTRWPAAAAEIVKAARHAGKPAVIDAEAPVENAREALSEASHVVFSEQGLADFCGAAGPDGLAQASARLGCWCAVTRGAASVLCHDGAQMTEVPTFKAKPLNTLGAGDAWHGAFTLSLAQGRSELDAVRWANAVACLKVGRSIHNEEMPTAQDVARFLNAPQGSV